MSMDTDNETNSELDISDYGWNPKTEVSIPPEMIEAIAIGLEEPTEIAARYGFTGARWEKLSAWAPFHSTVMSKRAEYEKNGVTFRTKSALKADMLADRVFIEAMQPSTNMTQRMAVLQYLTKVADLEPKEAKTASIGEGFSVTINLGNAKTTMTVENPPIEDVVDVSTTPKVTFSDVSGIPPLVDPDFLAEMQRNSVED